MYIKVKFMRYSIAYVFRSSFKRFKIDYKYHKKMKPELNAVGHLFELEQHKCNQKYKI